MRVFFAIWPPEEAGGVLHRLAAAARRECGGRAMTRETIHLTLAFVGEVDDDRLADLLRAAGVAAAAPGLRGFDLVLDRLGWWRHNRILWAGCGQPDPALPALAGALARALGDAGFPVERRPFAAHLTLLRNSRCAAVPAMPEGVRWPVREFVLVRSRLSEKGAHYEILDRWPLAADPPTAFD
ncbi:MAG TPA: RNA 2',3'-cyclic phosphodiesterase [Rhodocyclaceae bacterium]|nr:RNA 2',3'-cyclic phosphodiesterase [Rhodocyclaceae bacterium]